MHASWDGVGVVEDIGAHNYFGEHVVICEVIEDEAAWGLVEVLVGDGCFDAGIGYDAEALVVAYELELFFEEDGGAEFEGGVAYAVGAFIVVLYVEGDGDEVDGFDEEGVVWVAIVLVGEGVDDFDHAAEVGFPDGDEAGGYLYEVAAW